MRLAGLGLTLFLSVAALFFPPMLQAEETADALTKAALYIYDRDHATDGVEASFTAREIELLADQRRNLARMASFALDRGDSATAADIIGYFRLNEALPALKHRFLEPRAPYGWEGTGSDEASMLQDHQFVYHSRYLDALNRLFPGENLARMLELTRDERARIIAIGTRDDGYFSLWGRWMKARLGL